MKVAVVTDSGNTISQHFGRASFFLVFSIEDGVIVATEQRSKAGHEQFAHLHDHQPDHEHGHEHGTGAHSEDKHAQMLDPIRDCDAVIVRGMGTGAYRAVQAANIRPYLTELAEADAAARAYIDGTLTDHPEWLH